MTPHRTLLTLAIGLPMVLAGSANAAVMVKANVTDNLLNATSTVGDMFFLDAAATSGGDQTFLQTNSLAQNVALASATFALGSSGPGTVSVTGIGFASPGETIGAIGQYRSDAMTVTVQIAHLDSGGNVESGALGQATFDHLTAFSGAGEYYVAFDSPFSFDINGDGDQFRIWFIPGDAGSVAGNPAEADGSFTVKTSGGLPKLSVSGTFVPIPEPSAAALVGLAMCGSLIRRRR